MHTLVEMGGQTLENVQGNILHKSADTDYYCTVIQNVTYFYVGQRIIKVLWVLIPRID